jgi:MFS transporter, MHS family, proline/betaine transporter
VTTAQEATPSPEGVGGRKMIGAISASVFGWSLDLFDLFILLYVAPVVGQVFFPSAQPTLSLAAVYFSFAVTLLMRPIGSALFGHYADAHGRKGAMTIAVTGVGIATAAFGILPTIGQVGIIAPIAFLVLRLVQGIFVGGVVASTHTIGTESVPAKWRGLMSGLIGGGGGGIGALLASLIFWVTSTVFPGDAFAVWGWRCMFFSGLLSSVLGLYVMRGLEESPFFQQLQRSRSGKAVSHAPLAELFASNYRNVLLVNLLITFGGGAGYYLTSGYLPAFLKVINRLPNNTSSLILIGCSVIALISSVIVGSLSQSIGRKMTFIIVGIITVFALPWLYLQLAAAKDETIITVYALAIAFIGNAGYAPVLIFLNERFPTALRATGTGLSWNIGFALGGMMPTVVTFFSSAPADIPNWLAIFTAGIFVIYLIGSLVVPETKGEFQ